MNSARNGKMPTAERVTEQVICLPIYPDLDLRIVEKISLLIKNENVKNQTNYKIVNTANNYYH